MLTNTEKHIKKNQKSTRIILQKTNELIKNGNLPKRYRFPLNIQFEVTSKCNLACKHCYNRSGQHQKQPDIPFETLLKACRELSSFGGLFQATISGGEPLLLGERLWDMLDILHADGTIFNMITNGILFTANTLEHLKKYRFYWVQISIDSYTPDDHDEFRGMKGGWEKAVKAAYSVALSGLPLRIASSIRPKHIGNIERFVKMAINLGASYLVIGEIMPSGRAFDNPEIFLSPLDRDNFLKEIKSLSQKYRKEISILIGGTQRLQLEYAAAQSIDGAIVRPNGDVRLDCGCPFVIGNIAQDNIVNIWARSQECWNHPLVKKYIESCDMETGESSFINNYCDDDIYLY